MSNAGDVTAPDGWPRATAHAEMPAPPPSGPFSGRSWDQSAYGLAADHRSAHGLSIAVIVMLLIMVALSLFNAGAHANRASVLDDVDGGRSGLIGSEEIADADDVVGVATGVYALGLVGTGVLFIVWQHRHGTNARALSRRVDGLGPGWAIGGWFVPLGNLVLPALQIFGASRESDPELPARMGALRGRGSAVVVPWAVLFAAGFIISRVASLTHPDESVLLQAGGFERYVSDVVSSDRTAVLAALVDVAAAIAACVMVRRLTARQDRRAAALQAVSAPGYAADAGWTGVPAAGARGASTTQPAAPTDVTPPGPGAGWTPPGEV